MRRTIATAMLALIGLVGTAACGEDAADTATSEPVTVAVGQPAQVQTILGGSEVTVRSVKYFDKGPEPRQEKAEFGRYAVIDVQYKATQEEGIRPNTILWVYLGADNKKYRPFEGNSAGGYESTLPSDSMKKGDVAEGTVVIDVPAGDGKVQLFQGGDGDDGPLLATWQ